MQLPPSQNYMLTSNQTFIDLMYHRLLNISAPIAGDNSEQYYSAALDSGAMTLGNVAQSIAELTTSVGTSLYNSWLVPETSATTTPNIYDGVADQISRLYHATLGRGPDYNGLEYYINAVQIDTSLVSIANGFINSPEFQGKVPPGSSNATFTYILYWDVLGRAPSAAEQAYYVNDLANGDTRASVVTHFTESSEYIAKMAGVTNTEAAYAAIAERMPTTTELLAHASGFASNNLFTDAAAAAVTSGVVSVTNKIIISGLVPDQSTIELQEGTIATAAAKGLTISTLTDVSGKTIGVATANSLHVFDLSGVTYKKGLTIQGTAYDDTITLPSGGAVIEPMAGNDTLVLASAAASTIVLGARPSLLTGVATPYDNGFDTIGVYDANNVLHGGFKLAGKSATPDILNVDNFLGTSGKVKFVTAVDLDAPGVPVALGAASNGSVMIIETQNPAGLTLADLNKCYTLPVPTLTSLNSQSNYIAIAISHNASSNAYVYGIQHLGVNNTFSAAGGDQISTLVELVGVSTAFAGATSAFTAANII